MGQSGLKRRGFTSHLEVNPPFGGPPCPAPAPSSQSSVATRRAVALSPTILLSNLTPDALVDNVGPKTWRRLYEDGGIIEATWPRIQQLLRKGGCQ